MNATEMRNYAVELMKSRKGRNNYTNEDDRKYFFGKPDNRVGETKQRGWSDCSSACRAAIRAASGIDIGYNTNAQIRGRANGLIVDEGVDEMPDESKLIPGDCLYFKGNKYHVLEVGHVEMYTGPGELYGHGGGEGPQRHDLKDYCKSRKNAGRGYLMAIRWIPDDAENNKERARPLLKKGAAGPDVKVMQEMLIAAGYACGKYGADSEFGSATLAALKAFQQAHALVVDGECGPKTWAALDKAQPGDADEDPAASEPRATVRIAGGTWHVRTAPSTSAGILGYVATGNLLVPSGEETDGWMGVLYNGDHAWVSKKGVAK